jgi:hypothetical protein
VRAEDEAMRRIIAGTLVASALCAATLSAAPKAQTPATISLNTTVASFSAASTIYPSIGSWITFTVTFPKSVERYGPRILISCYQNNELVYAEGGSYDQSFMLGGSGSLWVYDQAPGDRQAPADCVAELFYFSYQGGQKWNHLADTSFQAGGAE